MQELLERLSAWGVNLAEVRARFLGDDALYIECLQSFRSDSCFAELDKALQDKDYMQAFDCAHTLKGVAGNLGLTPLYQATSDFVECLRHKEYDKLEISYGEIIAAKNKFITLVKDI